VSGTQQIERRRLDIVSAIPLMPRVAGPRRRSPSRS